MKRTLVLGAFLLASLMAATAIAAPITLYNSIPSPLPPNVPSLGYQATSTKELGQAITLVTGGTFDLTVTVAMSDWALFSQNPGFGTAAGFNQLMTMSLYNDPGNGSDPGPAFALQTVNAFIPYRPEADSTCPGGTAYRAADGNCYNGSLSLVQFLFSGVTLPDNLIYGLKFDTQSYGDNPTGVNGPYNSLNFGLAPAGSASVGLDTVANSLYWNTSYAPFLTDPSNVNTFSRDTVWDYTPAAKFEGTAVPEPASMLLLGTGLVGLGYRKRRRNTAV